MSFFSWYRGSVAQSILNSIQPGDITLKAHVLQDGSETFIWDLDGDDRFEDLRRAQYTDINDLAGFVLTKDSGPEQHSRWMEVALAVPTIQEALVHRFGDPNVIFKGLSLKKAKERWENATGTV